MPIPPTSKIASVATTADTTLAAMTGSLLDQALAAALADGGGRPFVTYYDDLTGERIELSVTTAANWVAKTANLLVDGLGLGPGDVVNLDLPRHWQLTVWGLATWTAGLTVDLGADLAQAQVAVCGPQGIRAAQAAGDVVALSLRPLGAPFPPGVLPAGVLDYGREVAGYGDRFDAPVTDPHAPALRTREPAGAGWTLPEAFQQAAALAARWQLGHGGRLLVAAPLTRTEELLAATLVPLTTTGSVVLCSPATPGGGAAASAARAVSEHITAVAGEEGE